MTARTLAFCVQAIPDRRLTLQTKRSGCFPSQPARKVRVFSHWFLLGLWILRGMLSLAVGGRVEGRGTPLVRTIDEFGVPGPVVSTD